MLEFDGNGLAGVEEDFVVLADGLVFVILDRLADGDDPAGDHGDFVAIGQDDSGSGFALVVILADDHALADGLDDVVFRPPLRRFGCHTLILSSKKTSGRSARPTAGWWVGHSCPTLAVISCGLRRGLRGSRRRW